FPCCLLSGSACLLWDASGLSSQFRRSAVSIAANISEGFRKRGKADKVRFYNIAQGSLEESRYYLILTKDLEYGDVSVLTHLIEETSKLLEAYLKSVDSSQNSVARINSDNSAS
ncbi:MAG: four helix bundle protein, partial [bacterium]